MDVTTQIIPAVIVVVANLFSGKHGSFRWETVTAIFGWTAIISLIAFFVVSIFQVGSFLKDYLLQIFGFCLLTTLSRDYERILHPLFHWNR
jgi:uncharacterized membrane protein YuzA (DUF378 family)